MLSSLGLTMGLLVVALPQSKLGPHVLGSVNDNGAQTILAACPRVAKWLTPDGSVAQEIAKYRANCPGGVVVLRVYIAGVNYSASDDAAAKADDFWSRMQSGLSGIPTSNVDWLEGPNELDNLPDWYHDWTAANWFAAFWSRLADRMNDAGYHPLVASIAVGNPSLAGEAGAGSQNYFKPTADAMKQKSYRWGWAYHGYTKDLTFDPSVEAWYSLRYRRIRTEAGVEGVPLVLTEGGQDIPTGWQGRGTTGAQFMAWLRWYDARMQEDPDVVGVTLFQVGEHGSWQNFDLGPVAGELAAYLGSTRPDGGVAVDAGSSTPDAGSQADAGATEDAGPSADAGAPSDGGASSGGNQPGSLGDVQGCACGATGWTGAATGLAWVLWALSRAGRRRHVEA